MASVPREEVLPPMRAHDILVAPSVLSADFTKLGEDLSSISTADYVHYDVMDGHFVPNISFGPDIFSYCKKSSELPIDVHLMVTNPAEIAPLFLNRGADVVTFHYEAEVHAHRLVHLIKDSGAKAGISLCPGTPVSVLEDLIDDLDLVLIMTVNPGFGGQKFIPHSIEKLKALKELCRKHNTHPLIEVDGGISTANAADVVTAGADMLVAGSAVFGQEDRGATIQAIRTAGESALTVQG